MFCAALTLPLHLHSLSLLQSVVLHMHALEVVSPTGAVKHSLSPKVDFSPQEKPLDVNVPSGEKLKIQLTA